MSSPSMTYHNHSKKSSLDSDTLGQQLSKSTYERQEWPGGFQTTLVSKFEEIRILLSSYFPSEIINMLLTSLAQ